MGSCVIFWCPVASGHQFCLQVTKSLATSSGLLDGALGSITGLGGSGDNRNWCGLEQAGRHLRRGSCHSIATYVYETRAALMVFRPTICSRLVSAPCLIRWYSHILNYVGHAMCRLFIASRGHASRPSRPNSAPIFGGSSSAAPICGRMLFSRHA